MNRGTIVRWEATTGGVDLRLWVDDEDGQHVTVCEIALSEETLISFARQVAYEQNRGAQYMLEFDR